jgi:hypothetical protein
MTLPILPPLGLCCRGRGAPVAPPPIAKPPNVDFNYLYWCQKSWSYSDEICSSSLWSPFPSDINVCSYVDVLPSFSIYALCLREDIILTQFVSLICFWVPSPVRLPWTLLLVEFPLGTSVSPSVNSCSSARCATAANSRCSGFCIFRRLIILIKQRLWPPSSYTSWAYGLSDGYVTLLFFSSYPWCSFDTLWSAVGVPQGSVLGSLLFNIFFSGLCSYIKQHSRYLLFADEIKVVPTVSLKQTVHFYMIPFAVVLITIWNLILIKV